MVLLLINLAGALGIVGKTGTAHLKVISKLWVIMEQVVWVIRERLGNHEAGCLGNYGAGCVGNLGAGLCKSMITCLLRWITHSDWW